MKHPDRTLLIFIAGLGHSGTTLLDLLLSSQPDITGLGETDVLIHPEKRDIYLKKFRKNPCSCGKLPAECPVWSSFRDYLLQNPNHSFGSYYRELIRITKQISGLNIISDSSKRLSTLKKFYTSLEEIGIDKTQFKVIHLIKDVRSFTASMLRDQKMKYNVWQSFRHWKSSNQQFETFLIQNRIPHIAIGYEELTLSTEFTMRKIIDFLDLDPSGITTELQAHNNHIAFGNKMRFTTENDKIRYDYKWFTESKINFLYGVSNKIQYLNTKWVYGNVHQQLQQPGRFQAPK